MAISSSQPTYHKKYNSGTKKKYHKFENNKGNAKTYNNNIDNNNKIDNNNIDNNNNNIDNNKNVKNSIIPHTSSVPATFYFRTGNDVEGCPSVQTFNDGMKYGPCNGGVQYNSESKYWVAIANGGNHCGRSIRVLYNGNSIDLKVMDSCPACESDNHVDMGLDALIELTGSKEEACAISLPQPKISWGFI